MKIFDFFFFDPVKRVDFIFDLYKAWLGPTSIETVPRIKCFIKKTEKQAKNVCGYFACAHATAACNNRDIDTLNFDEKLLTNHWLYNVLKKKR